VKRCERRTSNGKDSAEALEVGESARVVPVLGAEVALITDTTTVDDDAEDDEPQTSADLDGRQDEFDCDALVVMLTRRGR
jgi:hypothetical protein